jgi:SAM-dependent MidA family methyltransferase
VNNSPGFANQQHFFLTGVVSTWPNLLEAQPSNSTALSSQVQDTRADRKIKRALQTLLHPEMVGRSFQVLALESGIDLVAPLACFKFARDPRSTISSHF